MDSLAIAIANSLANKYTDEKIAAIAKGMDYKGSVSTSADLPLTNNKLGFVYTITEEGGREVIWTSNESSGTLDDWEELGGVASMSPGEVDNIFEIVG